eukprot:4781285-Pyramimonas_sp.AAC.1
MLHAASPRSLEREAARKAGIPEPRLCFDVVRNRLRSSKYTDKEKGSIRSLVCEALWTYGRAEKAVYEVSNFCALCGQPGDTVQHRLWACPSVASFREELVKSDMLNAAAGADLSDPVQEVLFLRGVFPSPGGSFPRPPPEDSEFQARIVWDEPPPLKVAVFFGQHFRRRKLPQA